MECVTLIDISSEDDLLIPSSSHVLGSETFSNLEAENIERVSNQMEQLSELSESPQQKCRSGRYSLRKSLAWDSEFFTGEGVLDHEELAIYNSTYSKAIGLKLPGIHEEFRKSVESTSTLGSESRALEKLEVDLLENLRTSSKRMLVASNQTPNNEQLKPDKPHPISLKKLDFSSQTKVASGNMQSKSSNKPTHMSSTTPLRTVNGKCSSSVMNKKIKNNSEKAFTEIMSKRQTTPALNKSKKDPAMAPRLIPSKESSLRTPQSVCKSLSALCSSSTRPAICSSDSSLSRLAILRSSSRNPTCSSSSFSSRTPLKSTRNRTGSANQICHSSLGKSALLLSKLSPCSSIDSFLSESSSQASTSTKHSNSLKASIGGSSSSSSIAVCASQKSGGLRPHSFTGNHSKIPSKFDLDTKGTTKLGLRMPAEATNRLLR
ncbi:uncharacterized protein LOC110032041 isoform X2 [Phalaenopsis equestris]|uniref:uncharacterized protein LOC110032041 isoform X2 n=1 Tax=Phalaenopsis equestris TaxID=78828 RepID=UPI0009E3F89B|nr:uncharacterized protein LOC110032041 isoform X2 [Phalaenopsis equestris]